MLGHVRKGPLDADEDVLDAGEGQDGGMRQADDPEGDVRQRIAALRRCVLWLVRPG